MGYLLNNLALGLDLLTLFDIVTSCLTHSNVNPIFPLIPQVIHLGPVHRTIP